MWTGAHAAGIVKPDAAKISGTKTAMSLHRFPQVALSIDARRKADVRSQFGALCYRMTDGKAEILLITSRGTGRWIVPKGWPVPGETPAGTAATEAYEEAGVEGEVAPACLGIYSYAKTVAGTACVPCVVALYAVRVRRLLRKYPESGERKRKWVSPKRAASMVEEPELRQIIKRFDPRLLGK